MSDIGPTLETARLILRPPTKEDFDAFADFMADDITKFVGGPAPRSTAWRLLSTFTGGWVLNGFSMFSWIEKETGHWIGRGGPWMPEGWPGTEVGWGVVRAAQGKGYAKEAAAAAIDWAFDNLGWTDVIHCIDAQNTASIATATSLGSPLIRKSVTAPPPFVDVFWDIYGQTRAQWKARR